MSFNYISLFSGIGCFEHVIHKTFRNATCLGYSEIDPYAIAAYQYHYPEHHNFGDITKINELQIKNLLTQNRCHLVVAGFPCQNLSSFSRVFGDDKGLKGKKSRLFFNLMKILQWIWKYNKVIPKIIIENNSSMNIENKHTITQILQKIDSRFRFTDIDNSLFGVQRRRRVFWTNFIISDMESLEQGDKVKQTWKDILLKRNDKRLEYVSTKHIQTFNKTYSVKGRQNTSCIVKSTSKQLYYFSDTGKVGEKSRWQMNTHSDTIYPYSLPSVRQQNFVIIRDKIRSSIFKIRKFHVIELERLFFLPDGYVSEYFSHTRCEKLLGNGISIAVLEFIFKDL